MKLKEKAIVGVALTGFMALGLLIGMNRASFGPSSFRAAGKTYGLTLDPHNAYVSGSTNVVQVDSGNSSVSFSYSLASHKDGSHVQLAKDGKMWNTTQITSITSLCLTFQGSLQARLSYDCETWGDYFALGNNVLVEVDRPYFVEFKALAATFIDRVEFTYSCIVNPDIPTEPVGDQLLGVIDFWDSSALGNTDSQTTVDLAYVSARSFASIGGAAKTLASSVSNNSSSLYGGRYGGIGFGSKSGYGDLTITLASGIAPTSVRVQAVKRDNGTIFSLNGTSKTISTTLSSVSEIDDVPFVEWTFANAPTSLEFTNSSGNSNRIGLYRIYLYGVGQVMPTPDVPEAYEIGFTASEAKTSYTTEDIFDSTHSLTVTAQKSDSTSSPISPENYTYQILDSSENPINSAAKFGTIGNYNLKVSYKSFTPVVIPLTVTRYEVLENISLAVTTTEFTTADTFATYLNQANSISVDLTYNFADLNKTGLGYSQLASNGVTLSVTNKSTHANVNINSPFGTPGTFEVKVSKGALSATKDITVAAILVHDITLNHEAIDVEKGKTAQLTATLNPENPTNGNINWTSSDSSVATVSASGLVTAVEVGEATITATAADGSGAHASCTINVLAPMTPDTWAKVTDDSTLAAGDKLVIGLASKGAVAGDITSQYMASVSASFANSKISSLPDNAVVLTLGGSPDAWTLSNENGQKLGATAAKKLAWGSGTMTWSISIVGGNVTIQNGEASFGRMLYNANSNSLRFTTYASGTSLTSTMLLPELYRGSVSTPVYPTSVSLSKPTNNELAIGDTHQIGVTYTPATTNQKTVRYSSSNEAAATVTASGLLTGVAAGKTTITAEVKTNATTWGISESFELTVKNVAVTGVSLVSSKTIYLGSTSSLTATVSPSNATNKNVTWFSSKTGVVTVDSTGVLTPVSLGSATITARTADGGFTATCAVTVEEDLGDAHTIMIYMCGSDLESGSGFATGDLKEILNVSGQPDDVNIIVETGGSSSWKRYGISNQVVERYHVQNRQLVKDTSLTDLNMGLSSTFQSFIEWGLTEYPAQRTGVIMWNHGGAMDGVCFDEKHDDDCLTNDEVNLAMKNAFKNVGRTEKLEWIGYDACLMAVQDIAEYNSQYYNYMISSQESEAGAGWDYDRANGMLHKIYANPRGVETPTFLEAICTTFVADNSREATLSALDLSRMPAYKTAWENMASGLAGIVNTSSKWNTFKNLVNSCMRFGLYTDDGYDAYNEGYVYDIFDVGDLIEKMQANATYNGLLSSQLNALASAFDDLVICSKTTSDYQGASGLNFFCPLCGLYRKSYYSSRTNFTNWSNFVTSYGNWKGN